MNALIELLESLSGNILPWLLLAAASLLAIAFAVHAALFRRSANNSTSGGIDSMGRTRNSNQSDAMRTMSELKMTWASKRNYVDTLRTGPIAQGSFAGWFAEENELCDSFATAKKKLLDEQSLREKEHPKVHQRYLEIVNESERKPHNLFIYVGLFLLMAVEATGFSLIFADRLSDTASAQAIQQYAVLISVVIAAFALYFADRIGRAVYRQEYAHSAHLHAPGNSLARSTNRALGLDDEGIDDNEKQSIRIINRSDFVDHAAADARRQNKLIPRFPIKLWIYVAGVVAFGAMVGLVRIGQIDEYYAKEAQKEAAIASSESAAPSKGNLSIPPGISQSKTEATEAISQEALDKEKRGKQLAIGVFIMIFFLAQTLGVVLAAARGFASNLSEEAFRAIKAFRDKHGDISLEQWKLVLQSEVESADRYSQEALTGWQLGLQTAFTNKAMPVPSEAYFAQCVRDFGHRTYPAFVQLKQHAAQAAAQAIATMPHVTPQYAQAPGVVSPPQPQYAPPVQPLPQHIAPPLQQPVPSGVTIEFFVTTSTGGEQVQRCLLAELQSRILSGQLPNLAALNVRIAGQPEAFVPWSEFAKRGVAA